VARASIADRRRRARADRCGGPAGDGGGDGGDAAPAAGDAAAGRLPWLGRLPGDIVVERGPVTVYFPIATSIIVSVALTLLFWIFRR